MRVRGVLFDFFGTLVDYTHGRTDQNFESTHRLLTDHGVDVSLDTMVTSMDEIYIELEAWSKEQLREFSMQEAMRRFLLRQGHPANPGLEDLLSDRYVDDWSQNVSFPHGIAPYLKSLSRRYRLGIITNTHHAPLITRLIAQAGIQDLFDTVITSIEHGRTKPHPDIFLDTLARLGLSAEEAVYVGDSFDADYRGATGAGMDCYLIGRHARVPIARQITSVFDLPSRL